MLELEVVHLEQYLLSLYRKAFDGQVCSVSPSTKDERLKSPLMTPRRRLLEISKPDMTSKGESSAVQSGRLFRENLLEEFKGIGAEEKLLDSSVHRCHSSLSQRSAFSTRAVPTDESLVKALRACHSQPLSMMEVTSTLNLTTYANSE